MPSLVLRLDNKLMLVASTRQERIRAKVYENSKRIKMPSLVLRFDNKLMLVASTRQEIWF